jgi:hypothetical protein
MSMKFSVSPKLLWAAVKAERKILLSAVMAATTLTVAFLALRDSVTSQEDTNRALVLIQRWVGPAGQYPLQDGEWASTVTRIDALRSADKQAAYKLADSMVTSTHLAGFYWWRGMCHRTLEQYGLAIADFDSASRRDTAFLSAHVWRGLAYAESAVVLERAHRAAAAKPVWRTALETYDRPYKRRWDLTQMDRLLLESFRWETRRALGLLGAAPLGRVLVFLVGYALILCIAVLAVAIKYGKQEVSSACNIGAEDVTLVKEGLAWVQRTLSQPGGNRPTWSHMEQLATLQQNRAGQDNVLWLIYGAFCAANALLLGSMFSSGSWPDVTIVRVLSAFGLGSCAVWYLIQRRALVHIDRIETAMQAVEDDALLPNLMRVTCGSPPRGVRARHAMVASVLSVLLFWLGLLLLVRR